MTKPTLPFSLFFQLVSIAVCVQQKLRKPCGWVISDFFQRRDESEFRVINFTSIRHSDRNGRTDLDNRGAPPSTNETRNLRACWNRRRPARTLNVRNDAVAAATRPTCWSSRVENAQQVVTIERQVAPCGLTVARRRVMDEICGAIGVVGHVVGPLKWKRERLVVAKISDSTTGWKRDRADSPTELNGDLTTVIRQQVRRID